MTGNPGGGSQAVGNPERVVQTKMSVASRGGCHGNFPVNELEIHATSSSKVATIRYQNIYGIDNYNEFHTNDGDCSNTFFMINITNKPCKQIKLITQVIRWSVANQRRKL